jgi:hypothetical protein
MNDTHARIIASAAKAALAPIGFRRQGRSRLWLADRGWWVNVVDFTPGRWSRSVSLMNAAHWTWTGTDFLSFDVAVPSPHHADFESDEVFQEACTRIADATRRTALALDARFPDFQAAADFAIAEAQGSPDRMGPSWWG